MKQASLIIEMLVLMILVVLTSGIVLFLVQSGILTVKAENEAVPILNAEFIPLVREGYLTVPEFQLCSRIDRSYTCLQEKENFVLGEEVHFRFVVESSVFNGEVMIIENYRLLDPSGKVILDVDEQNNFHFDALSSDETEKITFKDYFVAGYELAEGEYSLELYVDNPLLNKNVKITKIVGIYSYQR